MGALLTAFQGRLPAQRRVELTNPGDETATTENTTVSGNAETDASNEFVHRTGVTFDSTNSEHLTLGVKGVVYFLLSYRGVKSAQFDDSKREWVESCDAFARTRGSLAWQKPQTNSRLDPSEETSNTLPFFDRKSFGGLIPPAPGQGRDPALTSDDAET